MPTPPKARTVADFKTAHDKDVIIPAKIKATLESAAKIGPEHYLYESELVTMTGISQTDFGRYKGQFEAHVVEIDHEGGRRLSSKKRVWFPDKKLAAKLRGE